MHRKLLERATRCPECGKPVCSFGKRAFSLPIDRKMNCQHCGCGCKTPLWVYGVMVTAAGLAAYGWYRFVSGNLPLFSWYMSRESLVLFFWTYMLAGVVMMCLVPFRVSSEMKRAIPPKVRITRIFDYEAKDVYHGACNALRRSEHYEVTGREPDKFVLYVDKKDNIAYCSRYEKRRRGAKIALLAEARPDGRGSLVIEMVHNLGDTEERDKARELVEISKLIEEELELFQYQKIR